MSRKKIHKKWGFSQAVMGGPGQRAFGVGLGGPRAGSSSFPDISDRSGGPLRRSFESASPNSFDIPWMILPAPECMVSIHPGFVSSFSLGKHYYSTRNTEPSINRDERPNENHCVWDAYDGE